MNSRDEFAAQLLEAGTALEYMGVERTSAADVGGGAALNGAAPAPTPRQRQDEPPRKRLKMAAVEDAPASASRKRILEHKLLRLKTMRERFTEQLGELYFLQGGGNMMDYAAWRKRPPSPRLLSFVEARRPAALGAVTEPVPGATLAVETVVQAARAEAGVAARVAELARAGLWAERRLPRVLEPPRPKAHWDYLLEEMAWLAQDFAHERKWKKQAAKKCARAVQKYFQEKALAAQKAEKAHEVQLKKIAAFAAKEIRSFWGNVEKLVEWKRTRREERARKEELDRQLSDIVDRTERYSRQLAANLHAPPSTPSAHSVPSSPREDDEFRPRDDSTDDEETIAAAERHAADPAAELDELQRDSHLDLVDLLPPGYLDGDPPRSPGSPRSDTTVDSDDEDEEDDDNSSSSSDGSPARLSELVEEGGGGGGGGSGGGGGGDVEAAAVAAAALQPTGTTLSDTAVGTPVPTLLRHTLREYQHVGLHWLVTMHARKLNGILADEMGLGKTVQTIALLAHLAERGGDWGPHLVVAPTSLVTNWEMEFKKWCPAFKILTYYGTIRERKAKRVGWTKPNSFHVCITSYKLVVQDHQSFRRKRWKYLVLDEAQNIKNFKSQRWQMLLNFQTERRLLLTGTPLQNSLVELWSLMHFLMPEVFSSHSEFREWFAGGGGEVDGAGSGGDDGDSPLVRRLHAVLRPFLLRRLKADVERQMPRKYDHVLMCRLAKRQRFLYDDFMARAKTKESLASGNLLSVINVLMQLRKVCNHPDLFEPRPVTSPLHLPALRLVLPALALIRPTRAEAAARLAGHLAALEHRAAFPAHRTRHLAPPRRLVEELAFPTPDRPRPPPSRLRLHLRLVPRAPPSLAAGVPAPPHPPAPPPAPPPSPPTPARASSGKATARLEARRRCSLRRLGAQNERRCGLLPLYGADLRAAVLAPPPSPPPALAAPSLPELLHRLEDVIDKFTVCLGGARAASPSVWAGSGPGARGWRRATRSVEARCEMDAGPLLTTLHPVLSRQRVSFPHPRLLQYDCGKLQTLAVLLDALRVGGHRVLIFTQMTRVLDVLESFMSARRLRYLRLDGATRIDRRQPLVDRFNRDPRLFAFLLSTRSGGLGLNLTGADSVVFYDSDWNPSMDAQAQDRCHRIGQTRDVHVYRLVTAATVEENILRHARRKHALARLAIDRGRFTPARLRADNLHEIFGTGPPVVSAGPETETEHGAAQDELERALAAAEDEADAVAARAARDEARTDLSEFEDAPDTVATHAPDPPEPPDPLAEEFAALMKQLTPVEKYAMRLVESGADCEPAPRRPPPTPPPSPPPPLSPVTESHDVPDAELTYSRRDAAQVWVSDDAAEKMPMWCPPTPPSGEGDVYSDTWARSLYRPGPAPERLLPPPAPRLVRPPRDQRRARPLARQHHIPPSLFERAGPRSRPRARGPHAPRDPPAPDWTTPEDAALRRALRLQRLPNEPPAALTSNWEWAAELVADLGRAYRSPRACRDRQDRLQDPAHPRRHPKPPPARRRPSDHPRAVIARLDAIRDAAERRKHAPARRSDDAGATSAATSAAVAPNPKHAALLHEHGLHYDAPPSPMEVAARRADRITKEKMKAVTPAAQNPAPAAVPTPSSIPGQVPTPPPPRVLVAPPAAKRPRPEPPAQLVYRQQLAARQHLKILQHTGPEPALRSLQLQQLALRRAAPAGGPRLLPARPPAHVLLTHLASTQPTTPVHPTPPAPPDSQ